MVENPANPDSFELATSYALLYPKSVNVDYSSNFSKALMVVHIFNNMTISFQKKTQESKKHGKQRAQEMKMIRICERFLDLKPSSPVSLSAKKAKKGKASQPT